MTAAVAVATILRPVDRDRNIGSDWRGLGHRPLYRPDRATGQTSSLAGRGCSLQWLVLFSAVRFAVAARAADERRSSRGDTRYAIAASSTAPTSIRGCRPRRAARSAWASPPKLPPRGGSRSPASPPRAPAGWHVDAEERGAGDRRDRVVRRAGSRAGSSRPRAGRRPGSGRRANAQTPGRARCAARGTARSRRRRRPRTPRPCGAACRGCEAAARASGGSGSDPAIDRSLRSGRIRRAAVQLSPPRSTSEGGARPSARRCG